MEKEQLKNIVKNVLIYMPEDWTKLTTHRLDIYNEDLAKVQFIEQFEKVCTSDISGDKLKEELANLPTAFDYIRLGHPLSCILEWTIAKSKNINPENVISFSSKIMPIMAILRRNLYENIKTQIFYKEELPSCFDADVLKRIYNYNFELKKITDNNEIKGFEGNNVLLTNLEEVQKTDFSDDIDFIISIHPKLGSITLVRSPDSKEYIKEIQHVRRRESIAMTPIDCVNELHVFASDALEQTSFDKSDYPKTINTIKEITSSYSEASLGSCGLSIQYAITMGLIHEALENHKGKDIKLIVPPNCYGGTNDQARRVAACLPNVEIMDLPVDREHDMVQSVDEVLSKVAQMDAIPFIIAEIPTNPRVEVPDLQKLKEALSKVRLTTKGENAVAPVFILDQTFCPNVKFLGDQDILSSVKTISYVSGSKFPSGGLCTAGYCVANKKAQYLMNYIDRHLKLCDNIATDFQINILSKQLPSMIKRINDAYKNTRKFVNHICETLPEAKINFVSEELAQEGFTPSVFSLDLPTKGNTDDEKEDYKRDLNYKLINLMISEIPRESKHCVSYGQLKGCYWTIPATSTQGTTKEGDKDYIVRVAVSADFNLEEHMKVFSNFCQKYIK